MRAGMDGDTLTDQSITLNSSEPCGQLGRFNPLTIRNLALA